MYLFHRVLNTESSHKYNQFPPLSNRIRNRPLHYKWYNYKVYDVLVLLTLLLILLLPLCHGSIFLSSHCLIAKNVSDVADVLINWSYFCFRNKITLTFFPMSIFPVLCLCQNYDLWNRSIFVPLSSIPFGRKNSVVCNSYSYRPYIALYETSWFYITLSSSN